MSCATKMALLVFDDDDFDHPLNSIQHYPIRVRQSKSSDTVVLMDSSEYGGTCIHDIHSNCLTFNIAKSGGYANDRMWTTKERGELAGRRRQGRDARCEVRDARFEVRDANTREDHYT
jgi:hypothetical protein